MRQPLSRRERKERTKVRFNIQPYKISLRRFGGTKLNANLVSKSLAKTNNRKYVNRLTECSLNGCVQNVSFTDTAVIHITCEQAVNSLILNQLHQISTEEHSR